MKEKCYICLSFCIAMVFLITACQPTPEKEVIVQKDFPDEIKNYEDYNSESIVEYENGYEAPQSISESFQSNKKDLTVEIDSGISIPDVKVFPVVLIENRLLSQEEIDKMIFTLVGDNQLYVVKEKDQQDYADDITYFKGELAKLNAIENKIHLDEVRIERYAKIINVYQSDMQESPDYAERQDTGTELIQHETEEYHKYVWVECDIDKKELAKIYVDLSTEDNSSYFKYIGLDILEKIKITEENNNMEYYNASNLEKPNDLGISVQEAEQIAINSVKDFGLYNYKLDTESLAYKDSYVKYEYYYDCAQCYAFYFTPNYFGIPITYEVTPGAYNDYSKGWMYENLIVCVDDSGVIYMKLTEPSREVNKIQDGAELIEFGEIMDIFRQQILIQGAWSDLIEAKNRILYIDEITLGYMKIAVPDNPEEFILTPVWDFFGYKETEYDEETYTGLILDEENKYRTRSFRHSYLTINAIDGSIIDRSLGY